MDEKRSACEELHTEETAAEQPVEALSAEETPVEQAVENAVEKSPTESAAGGKRVKRGRRLWLVPVVLLALVAAAYLGLCAWARFDTTILPNTTFEGESYGGMTRSAAETKLAERLAAAQSARLDFVASGDGETVASVMLGELAVEADVQSIVGTMYDASRAGSFLRGGAGYLHALLHGMEVSDHSCDEAFRAATEDVLASLAREPVEFSAEVTESGEVRVTKARDGRRVTDAAEETVVSALRAAYFGGGYPLEVQLYSTDEGAAGAYEIVPARAVDLASTREKLVSEKVNARYDIENETIVPSSVGVQFPLAALESAYEAAEAGKTFTLTAAVELPEVTTEALEAGLFRDELSSYTTRVGGAEGRHKNVQLTAERIDGYILNAGETMQYGPLVTPFTKENGYFPAPGYLKGKTVDMYGGGACQASSTLYAAVLYANLEIVQRVNHGYASDYIGLGLDATVAEGGPEFEFRNSTLYPIKVCAEFFTKGGKDYIKITLLGTKTDDHYVKIITELLSTTPFEEELVETDELAPGVREVEQTAYTGYLVKTYRNVYAGDGTLLSSEYEATSRYNARNRIIRVGKAAETVIAPITPEDPAAPVTPVTPEEPTAPVTPITPEQPAEPVAPTPETPAPEAAGGGDVQSEAQDGVEAAVKNE